MLEIVNVSKHFVTGKGKTQTDVYPLKNVSLTVENGKKVGIVGKSGEGKSTLANIVCGLVVPSEGRVLIDGQPLWSEKTGMIKRLAWQFSLYRKNRSLLSIRPNASAVRYGKLSCFQREQNSEKTQKKKQ